MNKQLLHCELKKDGLVLLEVACAAAIGLSFLRLCWFTVQLFLAPIDHDVLVQLANGVPAKFAFAGKILRFFIADVSRQEAIRKMVLWGVVLAVGLAVLPVARHLLKKLEINVKQTFLPQVLSESFTDFSYEAKKRSAAEEILCDVGLLSRVERYYTANRLEGLYRDCWVASQEIICGGVYSDHYASHRVKVRGQWLTVRLDCDFEGTLILEGKDTANRFSHKSLARNMYQLELSYEPFSEQFVAYTDSTDDARTLLTRQMADNLLRMQTKYPDLCAIFRQGCIHLLIRRRSFDRRWEALVPFCQRALRREALRLYGPLQDFTDILLS